MNIRKDYDNRTYSFANPASADKFLANHLQRLNERLDSVEKAVTDLQEQVNPKTKPIDDFMEAYKFFSDSVLPDGSANPDMLRCFQEDIETAKAILADWLHGELTNA